MKVANQETIREGEREFIDTINAELNWESIEKLLYEKFRLALRDEVEYRSGGLMVYKDDVAYKFTFDVKVPISIVFDSRGECLDLSSPLPDEQEQEDELLPDEQEQEEEDGEENPPDSQGRENESQERGGSDGFAEKASELAGMMDEINQGVNDE